MTLPVVPPGPLSMSQIDTELQQGATTLITLNDTNVRTLAGVTTPASQISFTNFSGKAYTVAGNSGILTSGSSYTLPSTSGLTIKVLVIAGGGGGGGGTGRNSNYQGWNTGGGGGGGGGNAYVTSISVTPGQAVSFSIGGGGGAGNPTNGQYGGGSDGSGGSSTSVVVNGSTVASVSGGGGGTLSANYDAPPGGTAGTITTGSSTGVSIYAGSSPGYNTQVGGTSAYGYQINTTVGLSIGSIITLGTQGVGHGVGGGPATAGTIYGAGGGGGGSCQSDQTFDGNQYAAAGTGGAVFIWWGY